MGDVRSVDVAVIGAGPAGLAAAAAAAHAGARVLLLDQSGYLGGQIWRHRERASLPGNARRLIERVERAGVEHWSYTSVVDAAAGVLRIATPNGPVTIRAKAVVLATGARELFLPFPGWTLPNVFGVGGLQALIKSGLDVRGARVVIAGTGPLLLPVAATVARHGGIVVAVAEQCDRSRLLSFGASLCRFPSKLVAAGAFRLAFRRAPFVAGTWVARADGQSRVERARLTDGRREWSVDCDYLATACGLLPNVEVGSAIGCRVIDGALVVDQMQQTSVPSVFAAGECTGVGGEDLAIVEGTIAGFAAVGRPAEQLMRRRDRYRRFAARMAATFAPRPELLVRADDSTVICRCEDVCLSELRGESGAREAKLASRAGMGACQGRVCGPAMQHLFAWDPPTTRTPIVPVSAADLSELGGKD